MNIRILATLTLLALFPWGYSNAAEQTPQKSAQVREDFAARPNIVIVVADDLGWADVGYHGSKIATPNIDRIAAEGAALERFYVAPVCSPTRAGLMTGRYPIRFGAMRAVYAPHRKGGMDTSETTIADALATAGYEHRALVGKWHLGHSNVKYHPLRRGFTEFYGLYSGSNDYFSHKSNFRLDWHRGYESNYDKGYTTDLFADEAVNFIRTHAGGEAPFLLYLPFTAPHEPFQAKAEHLPLYADLGPAKGRWSGEETEALNPPDKGQQRLKKRRILGAMVHALDEAIGRILRALDEAGIADDTLVLFFSDNGGTGGISSNAPLRGTKASVFEGGVRVPAAARWPGKIPAGRAIHAPLAYIDVMPTLMGVAGIERPVGKPLDGIDMLGVLTGENPDIDRDLYSYIGQYGEHREEISYMSNGWKLVVKGPNIIDAGADDSLRKRYLFRIDRDPNETENLAAEKPDRVAQMYAKLMAFRALQPADAVPPYAEGMVLPPFFKLPSHFEELFKDVPRGIPFIPPKDWRMPE